MDTFGWRSASTINPLGFRERMPIPIPRCDETMLTTTMSRGELSYIQQGVAHNVRQDGRGRMDFREVGLEIDIYPHTNGSSRVILGNDGTEVKAAVKVEIGVPSHEAPDRGKVEVNVEISPMAAFNKDRYNHSSGIDLTKANAELTQFLERIITHAEAVDTKALAIIRGKFCWIVYLDVEVRRAEGNLLDAISFAAYAALKSTKIPKVDAVTSGLQDSVAGGGDLPAGAEAPEAEDFELTADVTEAIDLPLKNLGLCLSLNRIGSYLAVDTTSEEEACTIGRITVSVDETGSVCGVRKSSGGGLPARELPGVTQNIVQCALKILKDFNDLINGTQMDVT